MVPSPRVASPDEVDSVEAPTGFSLSLSNFSGPFDLLLSLISKRELDITEVSLSAVTDEFISYLHGLDSDEELDRASEFLVVAATLLDLDALLVHLRHRSRPPGSPGSRRSSAAPSSAG